MKIFKATRKCVMGALALTLAVSGALAFRAFARADAFAAEADGKLGYVGIAETDVSDDVKAVMQSFSDVTGVTKIEYVKDYAVKNAAGGTSGTVSGIRLNLKCNVSSGGYPNSVYPRSSIAIDASKLDYSDKLLGLVVDNNGVTDDNRMRVIAPYISNGMNFGSGDVAFLWISAAGGDAEGSPKSVMQVRNYNKAENKYVYEGIYNGANAALSLKANSSRENKLSLGGYTNIPFNMYYDFGDNALCADGYTAEDSKLVKFLSFPNDKYSTVPVNPAVSNETEFVNATTTSSYDFKPTADNEIYLGFRIDVGEGDQGIILTAFAGMDLTDPEAAFPEKLSESISVKTAGADEAKAGKEFVIPEIKFASDGEKPFVGTVDVFEGAATVATPGPVLKAEFISKNYALVEAGKQVGDTVTLGVGKYALVYKEQSGAQHLLKIDCKLFADVKLTGAGAYKFINADTQEEIAADTVFTINGDYKVIATAAEGYLDTVILKNKDVTPAVETVLNPNRGGTVKIDFLSLAEAGKIGVNNELVATARNYYTVNFVSFGETVKTAEVKQNAAIPFPEVNPSKKGYAFAGWKMGETVLDGSEVLPYAGEDTEMTVTIEAQNVLNQYKATLKLPEAYAGVATLNATSGTFTMLSDIDFAAPSVAEGLKFGGWFYNGKKITKGEQLPAEDVELYAYISKDVVTVTFMHGAEVVETAEVLKGKKATASKYSIDGYLLKGWFTDKAGTAAFDFETAVTADTTLYGVFVKLDDNTVTGGEVSAVKSEAKVLDNTNVKAFNLISTKGLVTMIIAIAGLAATVALAVLIILNLTKKKAVPISEDEAQGGESVDESIEK